MSKESNKFIQIRITRKPIRNDMWGALISDMSHNSRYIYFQNKNCGLQETRRQRRWSHHMNFMDEISCEINGLAETNTS